MVSLLLTTGARVVQPLLLLFSVFLLLRGHNAPGGGFAGGLVAAIAFTLVAIAYDTDAARRSMRVEPRLLMAVGLLLATGSGLIGLLGGGAFLQGIWFDLPVLAAGRLEFSTPLFFDIGVYLTVVGVTTTIVFTLAEAPLEERWGDVARAAASEEVKERGTWR